MAVPGARRRPAWRARRWARTTRRRASKYLAAGAATTRRRRAPLKGGRRRLAAAMGMRRPGAPHTIGWWREPHDKRAPDHELRNDTPARTMRRLRGRARARRLARSWPGCGRRRSAGPPLISGRTLRHRAPRAKGPPRADDRSGRPTLWSAGPIRFARPSGRRRLACARPAARSPGACCVRVASAHGPPPQHQAPGGRLHLAPNGGVRRTS